MLCEDWRLKVCLLSDLSCILEVLIALQDFQHVNDGDDRSVKSRHARKSWTPGRVSGFRGDETRVAPRFDSSLSIVKFNFLSSHSQGTHLNVVDMALTQRIVIVASSVALILIIALSLATAFEVRAPPAKLIQVTLAQAARIGDSDRPIGSKAKLNGSDFDRVDVYSGSSVLSGISLSTPPAIMRTEEGMLGATPTPRPATSTSSAAVSSASWDAEGVIGPISTPSPKPAPAPAPRPPPQPQLPIVALSYSGAGGPKHCRGRVIQQMRFPPPIAQWKNGTCVNLPSEARCGIFVSAKGDNCEAQLFNIADCYNTTSSYVNTVVFMPEERPVGALWKSMYVKCGVEVPEAKMLDPSMLGNALKPKPKPAGGWRRGTAQWFSATPGVLQSIILVTAAARRKSGSG
jgi:hypothetical protein